MKNQRIFLCHASEDKNNVLEVYHHLKKKGLNPWLDKEDLLPGQNWREEIPKAIRVSRFILIFFSKTSISKRGYVQKEFKLALDVLDEIPEGDIFVIPIRLDECEIPTNFKHLHFCDLFEKDGFEKILKAINSQKSARHSVLKATQVKNNNTETKPILTISQTDKTNQFDYSGFSFIASIKGYISKVLDLPIKNYVKSTEITFLRDWILVTIFGMSIYAGFLFSIAVELYNNTLLKNPVVWIIHVLVGLVVGFMIGISQATVLNRLNVKWNKRWIFANTISLMIGIPLGLIIYSVSFKSFQYGSAVFVVSLFVHLIVAITQWLAIREYIHKSYLWAIITPISSPIAVGLGLVVFIMLRDKLNVTSDTWQAIGFSVSGALTIAIISGIVLIALFKQSDSKKHFNKELQNLSPEEEQHMDKESENYAKLYPRE